MSLLAAATAQQPPPDPAAPTAAPDPDDANGSSDDTQAIDALAQQLQAKIPPQLQDAVQRIVLAGKKVLYSPQTSGMLASEIKVPGPVDKKLAGATAGLMALLSSQSQGSIPPAAYIPAATLLLLDIADAMIRVGADVEISDVKSAIAMMAAAVLSRHGASPDDVKATMKGQPVAPPPPAQPQPPAQPSVPPTAPAVPPVQPGAVQ